MNKAYPINRFLAEIGQRKPQNLLFLSVGNPSPKYDNTRHSAGHLALEYFTKNLGGLAEDRIYWDKSVEMAPLQDHPNVYMARSLEYMNNSGKAVAAAIKHLRPQNYRMVIIHDDIDTAVGVAKFKLESRQMGAHGGLNSITKHYPDSFARIRLGIGSPDARSPGVVASYVLKAYPPRERADLNEKTIPAAFEYTKEIVRLMDRRVKTKKPAPTSPKETK